MNQFFNFFLTLKTLIYIIGLVTRIKDFLVRWKHTIQKRIVKMILYCQKILN